MLALVIAREKIFARIKTSELVQDSCPYTPLQLLLAVSHRLSLH
jgi:hypothetical protein